MAVLENLVADDYYTPNKNNEVEFDYPCPSDIF